MTSAAPMTSAANQPTFSVLVPVGPHGRDLERARALLASLRRHESPENIELILIDDAPAARALGPDGRDWANVQVIRTPVWSERRPAPSVAMIAGTICGIRSASRSAEFVLKLDTDALVIGSFADQLRAAFAADPTLGIVGSYDRTCTGTLRDWSVWRPAVLRATRRLALRRPGRAATVRRLIAAARQNPHYRIGAHCLGGAYAVSSRLAAREELFRFRPWLGTGISEDVVMGVLCAAAGLRMQSMTGAGEPFGLAHKGLPGSAVWLNARGHSIVHSVKHADPATEAAIRDSLQAGVGA